MFAVAAARCCCFGLLFWLSLGCHSWDWVLILRKRFLVPEGEEAGEGLPFILNGFIFKGYLGISS